MTFELDIFGLIRKSILSSLSLQILITCTFTVLPKSTQSWVNVRVFDALHFISNSLIFCIAGYNNTLPLFSRRNFTAGWNIHSLFGYYRSCSLTIHFPSCTIISFRSVPFLFDRWFYYSTLLCSTSTLLLLFCHTWRVMRGLTFYRSVCHRTTKIYIR